jgi:type II secretory ATPase GspE/PulE/Tfp pilus assembly ATPase PilB-like protein
MAQHEACVAMPAHLKIASMTAHPSEAQRSGPAPKASPSEVLHALTASGRLRSDDAERARDLAAATKSPLPVVLDRLGLWSQIDWAEETARLSQLRFVRIDAFPQRLASHPGLNAQFLRQRLLAPLEIGTDRSVIAITDPSDTFAAKALTVILGHRPEYVVSPVRDIETALARAAEDDEVTDGRRDTGRDKLDAEYLVELANDAPTVKLLDTIFASALEREATDIHFEAFERATRLRFRIDGVLMEQPAISVEMFPAVISRLKILAGLDIAERRLPQDGRIRHRSHGREVDMRLATAPAVHGEAIAVRILNQQSGLKRLDDINMPTGVRRLMDWGLAQRNGLILVTGPTGSGKTTTLHAALADLNTVGRKVVSVEDPVEIQVAGVVQLESNPAIGLDFARALRSFLRHDPDVMMVGEIRDRETAEIAIQAALTGHLVLSTLHTNDAPSAMTRLIDMGVDRFLIEATLRVAAAQRLVRVLCTCARPSQAEDPGLRLLARHGHAAANPREPAGCPRCNGTGYRGRRAVFEAVAGADLAHGDTPSSRRKQTYQPLHQHALELISTGVTSAADVIRVIDLPGEA